MSSRIATQIVTLGLLAVTLVASVDAHASRYRVELKQDDKVLSSRTVDLARPQGPSVIQSHGGVALELTDSAASCGVFLQPQDKAANVIVTIIENVKNPDLKSVETKSAVLSKQTIAPKDQDVTPGADGRRHVTADSAKLNRSCTVSVI